MPPPLHLLLLLDRSGHMAKCQPDLAAAGLIYAFRPKLTGLKKGLQVRSPRNLNWHWHREQILVKALQMPQQTHWTMTYRIVKYLAAWSSGYLVVNYPITQDINHDT